MGVLGTDGEESGGESGISTRPQPCTSLVFLEDSSERVVRGLNSPLSVSEEACDMGGERNVAAMGETDRLLRGTTLLGAVSESQPERLPCVVRLLSDGTMDETDD